MYFRPTDWKLRFCAVFIDWSVSACGEDEKYVTVRLLEGMVKFEAGRLLVEFNYKILGSLVMALLQEATRNFFSLHL